MPNLENLKDQQDAIQSRMLAGYALAVLEGVTFTYDGPSVTIDQLREGIEGYKQSLRKLYQA